MQGQNYCTCFCWVPLFSDSIVVSQTVGHDGLTICKAVFKLQLCHVCRDVWNHVTRCSLRSPKASNICNGKWSFVTKLLPHTATKRSDATVYTNNAAKIIYQQLSNGPETICSCYYGRRIKPTVPAQRYNVVLTHDSGSVKICNLIWVHWHLKILEGLGTNQYFTNTKWWNTGFHLFINFSIFSGYLDVHSRSKTSRWESALRVKVERVERQGIEAGHVMQVEIGMGSEGVQMVLVGAQVWQRTCPGTTSLPWIVKIGSHSAFCRLIKLYQTPSQ